MAGAVYSTIRVNGVGEGSEIVAVGNKGSNIVVREARVGDEAVEVSGQATGVIVQRGTGTEVYSHVLKRPIVDAAGAGATRDGHISIYDRYPEIGCVVRDVGSIAAQGGCRAIKKGIFQGVVSMVTPVPVWLCTAIAAFIGKCLFIGMEKISVPGKKNRLHFDQLQSLKLEYTIPYARTTYCKVDSNGLVDVGCNKIIVSVSNSRSNRLWCNGWS